MALELASLTLAVDVSPVRHADEHEDQEVRHDVAHEQVRLNVCWACAPKVVCQGSACDLDGFEDLAEDEPEYGHEHEADDDDCVDVDYSCPRKDYGTYLWCLRFFPLLLGAVVDSSLHQLGYWVALASPYISSKFLLK